jgi:uncharacterized membrane protein YtjA (UPF0391 family)
MFGAAAAFLVIALVAAAMGSPGVAGMLINIAWILFLFGAIFAALLRCPASERDQGRANR